MFFQSAKHKELVRGGYLLHLASILSYGPVLQATGREGPTGPSRVLFLWPEPGSFSLSSKESGERTQQLLLLTHGHLCTPRAEYLLCLTLFPESIQVGY